MDLVGETASSFAHLTLQVLPWFAVGTLTAAIMRTFVPPRWAAGALSGRRGLPIAIGAGAVLPGCSCTTMPLAIGLRGMIGPRLGTLTAFIFVSPLLSPITIALTWSLLGWQMTVARVVAALLGSAIIGLLINRAQGWLEVGTLAPMAGGDPALDKLGAEETGCCKPELNETAGSSPARRLGATVASIVQEVGPYFLLGMLVAAILSAAVPEDALPALLGGSSGIAAFALAAVVGIPLYVCEGEEVPLTYGLIGAGLGPGPAFTFLMGSVGTCVPTILMSRAIIGRRATYFYVGFWIVFAIVAGLTFSAIA
jgi:uncharacterized membrane protein YraQ (UPF0718 family)